MIKKISNMVKACQKQASQQDYEANGLEYNTIIKDDRTPEQLKTHVLGVMAYDECMSGWGQAENRKSYCVWTTDDANQIQSILEWVQSRSDMQHARIIDLQDVFPLVNCHIHIYIAPNL